ncbi:hypothetical protein B0J18DRAFT_155988 [Chaetomium sp. MPI-SDFR-AT-0129]|nr:hypothetical protein B0J18DRAFT_155988 [Chaetomium sp. MPI-SDFR-AT-0129]
MPPFLTTSQLQNAIEDDALPTLKLLAADQSYLDDALDHRFGQDEPPGSASSSEPELDDEARLRSVFPETMDQLLKRFKHLVKKPLDDLEIEGVIWCLHSLGTHTPGRRYDNEAGPEKDRLFFLAEHNRRVHGFLKGPGGGPKT